MLKSSKSNYSTKRKPKGNKMKKNASEKSQNTRSTRRTNSEDVQQNANSVPVSSGQSNNSLDICPNDSLDQEYALHSKNNVSETMNNFLRLTAMDGSYVDAKELNQKRTLDELFNMIYTEQVTLHLPNRSWSIHYAEVPIRCIVISEITLHNDSGLGFVPLYTKQIIFYEKMKYDIFLFNSKASEKNLSSSIETLTDVMNIIVHTNNLKLCRGGPEISLYNNVNLECAYRDNKEKWRHNLCSLEVSEGDICELCLSLEDILKRHIQRNKQSSRTKNFNGSGKRKRTS